MATIFLVFGMAVFAASVFYFTVEPAPASTQTPMARPITSDDWIKGMTALKVKIQTESEACTGLVEERFNLAGEQIKKLMAEQEVLRARIDSRRKIEFSIKKPIPVQIINPVVPPPLPKQKKKARSPEPSA